MEIQRSTGQSSGSARFRVRTGTKRPSFEGSGRFLHSAGQVAGSALGRYPEEGGLGPSHKAAIELHRECARGCALLEEQLGPADLSRTAGQSLGSGARSAQARFSIGRAAVSAQGRNAPGAIDPPREGLPISWPDQRTSMTKPSMNVTQKVRPAVRSWIPPTRRLEVHDGIEVALERARRAVERASLDRAAQRRELSRELALALGERARRGGRGPPTPEREPAEGDAREREPAEP